MYGEVSISTECSLVSLNMTCSPSLVSVTMICGPYLKSSNIFISAACLNKLLDKI